MRTLLISLACVVLMGCANKTGGVHDYGDFEDSSNSSSSEEKAVKATNTIVDILGFIASEIASEQMFPTW